MLDNILEENPNNALALRMIAWSKRVDIEESKMWYQELLNQHPTSRTAVENLIKIAKKQNDEKAEKELFKLYYKLGQAVVYKERNSDKWKER